MIMTIKKARKMIRKATWKLVTAKTEKKMDKIERKIFILQNFITNEKSFDLETEER